ncbi:MAG: hypothetical protein K6G67_07480 [Lachnospiraceae bacterium]|nr:hypothetical protein [Lachnospiraceae bacterium]
MNDLSIEFCPLGEKIKELFKLYIALCKEIENTAESVQKLDIFWDGDANYAYITRIQKDMLAAGKLLMSIRETIMLASKAYGLYNENEKRIKRMIGGMRR